MAAIEMRDVRVWRWVAAESRRAVLLDETIAEALTGPSVSACFGIEVEVARHADRWAAMARHGGEVAEPAGGG